MTTENFEPGGNPPSAERILRDMPPQQVDTAGRIEPSKRRSIPMGRWVDWRIASVVLLAGISIAVWRVVTNPEPTQAPPVSTALAQPVAAARVSREDLYNEVTMTAEFRPYLQVDLHAKVSGYVAEISVDIGDRVKAGQLLAKLEMPELKSELARALAAEKRAEADYKDAHLVYTRLLAVEKAHANLVAQQELDAAEAKDGATEAAIGAAKAEVERYETLLAYTHITAPFDGVITRRYADPGSLIQAGTTSDTQSSALVRLSDNYRLRLDFPVSVTYVKDVRIGEPLEVRVESFGGKTLTGTISRFAQKVDEDTRTMLTEIEMPNPDLELVPGMYATVVLKVERRPQALTIPTEAVSPESKTKVFVINNDNEIEERPVTIGLETPTKYEVIAGLKEGERVFVGSRSQVKPGQKVVARLIGSLAQQ